MSRNAWPAPGLAQDCRTSVQPLLFVSILRSLTMKKFHVVRTMLAITSLAAIVIDLGAGHKFLGA